jgi:hypothetical protein
MFYELKITSYNLAPTLLLNIIELCKNTNRSKLEVEVSLRQLMSPFVLDQILLLYFLIIPDSST